MPAYRAYFLDPDDHIIGTEVIEVGTLSLAVGAAMALLKGLPEDQSVELWGGERRLCSLPPSIYRRRAVTRTQAHAPDPPAVHHDLSEIVSRLAVAREHLFDEDCRPLVRQVVQPGSFASGTLKPADETPNSNKDKVQERSSRKIVRM